MKCHVWIALDGDEVVSSKLVDVQAPGTNISFERREFAASWRPDLHFAELTVVIEPHEDVEPVRPPDASVMESGK